ncbi:MAG: tetratricopeptide repeat protein [Myxococcales bacterium]
MLERSRPLALALATLVGGCFYPADRGKLLEARVDRLESEKRGLEEELLKQKQLLAAQLPKLDQQFERVEKALDTLDRASRSNDANIGVQLEMVKNDIALLRGSIEEYVHKLNELETALAEAKSAPATAAAESPKKKAEATEKPADKKEFLALVEQKLVEEPAVGRQLAAEWLKKFGRDPLAARAHFALGNSYLNAKEYRAALSEFGEIVKNHGNSEHAAPALLQSSECFAALKMKPEAQLALEEIINSYPKTEAAKTARARLAELKKGGKK